MNSEFISEQSLDTEGRIELKAPLSFEKYHSFCGGFDFFSKDFKVVFPERVVHNTYFDTLDLKLLEASKEGEFTRAKIRFRHYNEDKHGQLEFKIKDGRLIRKMIRKLPCLEDSLFEIQKEIVKQAQVQNKIGLKEATFPVIKNSYSRQYLEHASGIRMTIDTNLKYQRSTSIPEVGSELAINDNVYALLEWKFAPKLINEFNEK